MLRQRILTAVIGLPLFLALIWFGNPWFTAAIAIAAVLGSIEFYRMTTHKSIQPVIYVAIPIIVLLTINPYYPSCITKSLILTIAIITSLIWFLFLPKKNDALRDWALTIAGILYLGWMLSYWTDLRSMEHGRDWIYWSMITIMVNDTSAFFVGRAWGKLPMAPAMSPKKTWEGASGGLVASIIVSIILGKVFSLPLTYWQLALTGCVISVLAQASDLVESMLKRNAGLKDSGSLLPGHGGILDRIDSFIFTGALVYYLAIAIG